MPLCGVRFDPKSRSGNMRAVLCVLCELALSVPA